LSNLNFKLSIAGMPDPGMEILSFYAYEEPV